MKRSVSIFAGICLSIFGLAACSGLPQGNGGGGGGTGSATLGLTVRDTPPAGISVLSFTVTISGIELDTSSGAAQSLLTTPVPVELTRLQSDSDSLGSFSVPAGSYSTMKVAISGASFVFLNTSGSTIAGCTNNSICTASPASATTVTISSGAVPVTFTTDQKAGIALDFDVTKALTASLGVDFTQAGALTASPISASGTVLDVLEDFTGAVTSVSGSSVTIQSGTRGSLTATANSSTTYDDRSASAICGGSPGLSCVTTGRIISVDATINNDGTVGLTEVDFLNASLADEIEGTLVASDGSSGFLLVVQDKTVASAQNATMTGLKAGSIVDFTVDPAATFGIDLKNLPVSSLVGFAGASDFFPGQTLRLHAKSATTSGSTINVVADDVQLRWSRFTATVSTQPAGGIFAVATASLPAFMQPVFSSTDPLVQTYVNSTVFDGVADASSLAVDDSISVRALFVNASPTFHAAKLRKR